MFSKKPLRSAITGSVSNLDGIGARIYVHSGDSTQMREVNGGRGLFSQDSHIQHFGLGERTSVDQIVVQWPSGTVQVVDSPEINQVLYITEE